MRSTLSRLTAGLLLFFSSSVATAAEAAPADPSDVYGVDSPVGHVLPTGDLGLPASASPLGGEHGPLTPTIEAIPTPTAFHAGVGLLVVAFVVRRLRPRPASTPV